MSNHRDVLSSSEWRLNDLNIAEKSRHASESVTLLGAKRKFCNQQKTALIGVRSLHSRSQRRRARSPGERNQNNPQNRAPVDLQRTSLRRRHVSPVLFPGWRLL